jgi:hypothetical protein
MYNVQQADKKEIDYYNERWRSFDYANLFSQERCAFIPKFRTPGTQN